MTGDEGRPEGEGSDRVVSPISDVLRSVGSGAGGDPDRTRSLTSSRTLTLDDLNSAFAKIEEVDNERSRLRVERYREFMANIPEGLHRDQFILLVASAVAEGAVFHPRDAKDINDTINKMIAEHERKLRT